MTSTMGKDCAAIIATVASLIWNYLFYTNVVLKD
mgnify:CR=1 FL=1